MSIYERINAMDKSQGAYVVAVAKERAEELDKKMTSLENLLKCYHGQETVRLYEQNLLIDNMRHGLISGVLGYEFSFNNGSKIIIKLD